MRRILTLWECQKPSLTAQMTGLQLSKGTPYIKGKGWVEEGGVAFM